MKINHGTLPIWKNIDQVMVHHIDLSWNTVESSLVFMHEKLAARGFTYRDGRGE